MNLSQNNYSLLLLLGNQSIIWPEERLWCEIVYSHAILEANTGSELHVHFTGPIIYSHSVGPDIIALSVGSSVVCNFNWGFSFYGDHLLGNL